MLSWISNLKNESEETSVRGSSLCGYLWKMKRTHQKMILVPQWNKRWFSIEGRMLKWYASASSDQSSGVVDLRFITNVSAFEARGVFSFILNCPDRNILLRASNASEMSKWIRALQFQADVARGGCGMTIVTSNNASGVNPQGKGRASKEKCKSTTLEANLGATMVRLQNLESSLLKSHSSGATEMSTEPALSHESLKSTDSYQSKDRDRERAKKRPPSEDFDPWIDTRDVRGDTYSGQTCSTAERYGMRSTEYMLGEKINAQRYEEKASGSSGRHDTYHYGSRDSTSSLNKYADREPYADRIAWDARHNARDKVGKNQVLKHASEGSYGERRYDSYEEADRIVRDARQNAKDRLAKKEVLKHASEGSYGERKYDSYEEYASLGSLRDNKADGDLDYMEVVMPMPRSRMTPRPRANSYREGEIERAERLENAPYPCMSSSSSRGASYRIPGTRNGMPVIHSSWGYREESSTYKDNSEFEGGVSRRQHYALTAAAGRPLTGEDWDRGRGVRGNELGEARSTISRMNSNEHEPFEFEELPEMDMTVRKPNQRSARERDRKGLERSDSIPRSIHNSSNDNRERTSFDNGWV